jgi:hypothetical protein
MTHKRFEVAEPLQLRVNRCGGPLTIRGWDQPAIEIEAEGSPCELETRLEDATVTVESHRTCSIRCPRNTTVCLGTVAGHLSVASLDQAVAVDTCDGPALLREIRADVSLRQVRGGVRAYSVDGSLRIGQAGGNASLKSIGGVATVETVGGTLRVQRLGSDLVLKHVGGDLRARIVSGSVNCDRVSGSVRAQGVGGGMVLDVIGGNVHVRDLGGELHLRETGGNLRASVLNSGMEIGIVGGNLHLEGPLVAGQSYEGNARGNASLRLPMSTSARLDLKAGGRIQNDLPVAIETQDGRRLVAVLGEGAAQMTITAGGNIRLREWAGADVEAAEWIEELESLAEHLEKQVDDALRDVDLEAIGREVETKMAQAQQKLDSVDWERLGREAQRAADTGIAQAQEAIQRVLRRMEAWRDAQYARPTKAGTVKSEPSGKDPDTGSGVQLLPGPVETADAEVMDTERMAILRMVEGGQITPDEGEMLLDALEE